MLQFFRNFFQTKFGVVVAIGFLGLIALAFAGSDISNSGKFGGVAGGDRVASVGKARISTSSLSKAVTSAFENIKQDNPTLTMKAFLAENAMEDVLTQLIDRTAIGEYGQRHGIIAGDRLVDSEIAKIAGFRGPDGKFSKSLYDQMLQQRGITDALVREDLAQGLVAKQVLVPASFGATFPRDMAVRYAALLRETREGSIALIPSAVYAAAAKPSDAEIATHYGKIRNNFLKPERRVIRFAVFGDEALKAVPAPTDAEVAARYNANKAQYAASEGRRFTQLIVPTEAAAKAIVAEVAGGSSLDKAASSKGLSTATVGPIARDALAGQASQAVADAVFAAARGSLAAPARSAIGWHVIRLDAVEAKPARTLDQVRAELSAAIAIEKRRTALTDFSAGIEEEFDNGSTLADVAKELGLAPVETPPLTADGKVYGKPDAAVPPALAKVLQAAFAMESENQPQLAEIEAGKTFIVFDVTAIAASAPAPLAEVKDQVAAELLLEKGATDARKAADQVLAAVRKGTDLGAAMTALGKPLPPVDRLTMTRVDLTRMQGQVPPPLALMFSMAEGTVKLLPAPRNRGWYIVALKDIIPGAVPANDPVVPAVQRELGSTVGREYADQLRRAIRADVGVERNEAAIKAVLGQLTGSN